ncbi:eRF1 1 domain-containing protein [Citrus sinensis]|nr:eRF1 1 domain-containing protein [Citrus sinensis]
MAQHSETDSNIEMWKMKKLIKTLSAVKGDGTSLISLVVNPRDKIPRVTKMLGEEYQNASKIKKRMNRQSVQAAITYAQSRLKLYKNVPSNGLVLFTGTGVTEDEEEKKFVHDLVPFKPINSSLYVCDSSREVVLKFTVDLPKKHGRGGQSALRFSRLRVEKRHNYLREAAELATKCFIDPATNQPNVTGLILAGSAEFKTELSQSGMFDPRLRAKILKVLDISYGGVSGFNQAIELSSDVIANVNVLKEKRVIGKFFEEIGQDTGKFVVGVDDTVKALEMGAIHTLIVWEDLDINRYELKHSVTNGIVIKHLNKRQEADPSNFKDSAAAADLKVEGKMGLLEWLVDHYKQFGCSLEIVTDKSQEGSQFCKGFGGIGGILRYQLDNGSFGEGSGDGEAAANDSE